MRAAGRDGPPDFLFPQMTDDRIQPANWRPQFVDYLYVSLTNALALSPTDTMPLSRTRQEHHGGPVAGLAGDDRPDHLARGEHPSIAVSGRPAAGTVAPMEPFEAQRPRPPGTQNPRPRRKLDWELIACGFQGHALFGLDAAEVRPAGRPDRPRVRRSSLAPLPSLRQLGRPTVARGADDGSPTGPPGDRGAAARQGPAGQGRPAADRR